MTLQKRIYQLIISAIVLSGVVYYMGCATAESTTGKLAFQQMDFAKAEVELKKGLAVDKNDDEGWYMLGYSQVQLGKLDDAKYSFQQCRSISNNYAEKITLFWIENFNAGAKSFQNGIEAENKKEVSKAADNYKSALKSFQAATSIIPDSLKGFSAVAESYLALGQKDKALEVLNMIVEKSHSPEDAQRIAKVIFETGLNLMKTNEYQAAVTTFKKILTINSLPKNDPYYETSEYNTGLALAKLGEDMRTKDDQSNYKEKYSEALTYLEPLTISLTKKDLEPQIYELLVTVYANLGMTDKAQDALKKKDELKK